MARWQVRYHRAILDSSNRVMFPAGAIIDRLELVDPGQHDKLIVIEDEARPAGVPLVKAKVTVKPARTAKEEDEEC